MIGLESSALMNLPFTKSRFRLALECPTKLHYAAHPDTYPNAKDENDLLAALAEGGFQVGEFAKRMHPGGVEVTARGHDAQVDETLRLMQQPEVTIFEAAFRAGDLFIRADLLRKHGNAVDLVEVKAKAAPENGVAGFRVKNSCSIHGAWLPYLQDVAFQTYVLRLARPDLLVTPWLMLVDTGRPATVDGLNRRFRIRRDDGRPRVEVMPGTDIAALGEPLLIKFEVLALVEDIINGRLDLPGESGAWADRIDALAAAWKEGRKLGPSIGSHCGKCEFRLHDVVPPQKSGFVECWTEALNVPASELAEGTVLDLWNFRGKAQLIEERRWRLSDVTADDIKLIEGQDGLTRSQRQHMQATGRWSGGEPFYLDRDLLRLEMSQWDWPLHLIDFETAKPVLPFHKGRRPYGLIAFQFSHHVLEADGKLRHACQCLRAAPGSDPNMDFVRDLRAALGGEGTVCMWSNHERTVLTALRRELQAMDAPPDDAAELCAFLDTLLGGTRALYDLCKLAERAFFHPATKARSSLKVLLPAVLGSSNWLRARYTAPIYGAPSGIPSSNFHGISWWQPEGVGVKDPYALLGPVFTDLPNSAAVESSDADMAIAAGGAAAAAYVRLQSEEMASITRSAIEAALLRYCELDTLAMAMVVEAWRDWCGGSAPPPARIGA